MPNSEHGGATVIELEPIERRVQAALKSTTTATE
jgi:hypothetical protein